MESIIHEIFKLFPLAGVLRGSRHDCGNAAKRFPARLVSISSQAASDAAGLGIPAGLDDPVYSYGHIRRSCAPECAARARGDHRHFSCPIGRELSLEHRVFLSAKPGGRMGRHLRAVCAVTAVCLEKLASQQARHVPVRSLYHMGRLCLVSEWVYRYA